MKDYKCIRVDCLNSLVFIVRFPPYAVKGSLLFYHVYHVQVKLVVGQAWFIAQIVLRELQCRNEYEGGCVI